MKNIKIKIKNNKLASYHNTHKLGNINYRNKKNSPNKRLTWLDVTNYPTTSLEATLSSIACKGKCLRFSLTHQTS